MKLVLPIFALVAFVFAVTEAFPSGKESELLPGIPTSLFEVENQQLSQSNGEEQSPLAREKRHKKKVVVINQYYGRPGNHGGYGQGCRGCGGGGYGYANYGNGYPSHGYPGGYGGHQGGYGGYGGHGHNFKG